MPIVVEELLDSYRVSGLGTAAATGAYNFIGGRSSTYPASESQTRRRIRAAIQGGDIPEAIQLRDEWNRANPTNPIRSVQ